ncbi:serine--tRNA ligase [Patescibacteria group bacterium]|nr:MAG: serine--tRNA ligase [Patescibacteria group bacterium]
MIDRKLIREQTALVRKAVADRRLKVDVDALVRLEEERLDVLRKVEDFRAMKRRASDKIAQAPAEEKQRLIAEMKDFDRDADKLEKRLTELDAELDVLLAQLPNIPLPDVPVGPDESGNVETRRVGEPTAFDFPVKDHVALGAALGVIDQERAVRVSGARFVYLMGDLVRIQNALGQLVMDLLTDRAALGALITKAGLDVPDTPFVPVVPPLMITPEVFARMGRLEPREERYHVTGDDLYLIGSAEHTLGPLHMDEILAEADLPLRYVALTPAFRREAGSYGKDTRGILRLHQFDKMEMESFALPERGLGEQELFVAVQQHVVASLGIPYRVMQICTGDMGTPDARQIDIECWMPGQQTYRETHTSDYMTDFQARRLNTRVKRADGTTQLVHMNDATAVAMGRMLIAIMENYQERNGGIRIPDVLKPYLRGLERIAPRD